MNGDSRIIGAVTYLGPGKNGRLVLTPNMKDKMHIAARSYPKDLVPNEMVHIGYDGKGRAYVLRVHVQDEQARPEVVSEPGAVLDLHRGSVYEKSGQGRVLVM